MMKRTLAIITTVALSTTIASAELVGSLHLATGQATNGFDTVTGLVTRTSNGNPETQGTVAGDFSCIPGTSTNKLASSQIKVWSGTTQFIDISRYAGEKNYGLMVWDFDLTNRSANAWTLKVDYEGRRNDDSPDDWYISINGLGRSLDTTDTSTLSRGDGGGLVTDASMYIPIGRLPENTPSGINEYNLTDIIEAAIANGGKVRLVYAMSGYYDDVTFLNDSGLIAGDDSTGDVVKMNTFYIADAFESGSGNAGSINGWVGSGPEPKEYNETNYPGLLSFRDLNADEKNAGNGPHAGYWDTLSYTLEEGITLADTNDWFQLQMDVGIFLDASGVGYKDGRGLRISFTDANASSNAGFGFLLQTGTNSIWSQLHEFDSVAGYGASLDGASYAHPFDGTLAPLFMRVTKAAGGYDIAGSWGGSAFDIGTVSNSLAETFDTLTLTVAALDVAFNLDNVYLISNVDPIIRTPYEKWVQLYNWNDSDSSPAGNPDGDALDNQSEYVFGGDPTIGTDIGMQPTFSTSGYVYTLRNDTSLNPLILTRDDLVNGGWATNDVADAIALDDENLSSYTNGIGTGGAKQFYKLLVE